VIFVILYVFRRPLKELIPRVRKASPTGIEIEAEKQIQLASKWTGELKQLPGFQRTAAIASLETKLNSDLMDVHEEERLDLLVHRLAIVQLTGIFERIYGAIYGSQIAGLRELARTGKVTMADALKYFDKAKSDRPELSNVEFAAWLEFLRVFNLIKIESDTISITDLGRDFLLYLTQANLNEAKSG
jgi:hypothetical protein